MLKVFAISLFTLWVFLGLTQVDSIQWRHLDYRDGLPEYAGANNMALDSMGRVWIPYERGLFCYDGYRISVFSHQPTDSTTLAEECVQGIYVDPAGKVWAGTRNKGISIYDPATGNFSQIRRTDMGGPFPEVRIWRFFKEDENTLWISCNPGLVRHDLMAGTFEHFVFEPPEYSEFDLGYYNTGREIFPDPLNQNRLYWGTRGGLLSFDKVEKTFTHHRMPPEHVNMSVSHSPEFLIMYMSFISDTLIQCSTWGGGMNWFNTLNGEWEFLHMAKPGFNTAVCQFAPRNAVEYWIVGDFGFGLLNRETKTYAWAEVRPEDPRSIRYHQSIRTIFLTPDKSIISAGTLGLEISMNAPEYDPALERFRPFLSAIKVNGVGFDMDSSVSHARKIHLEEDQNTIEFTAVLPVFQNIEEVRYQFKLDGFDKDWRAGAGENGRTMSYSNLSGRSYTLHFRAGRPEMPWRNGITSPRIIISVAFWKKPLFIALVAFLIAGLAIAFYSMHIRRIKNEQSLMTEFNKKLANVEMSALRAQMNPHFMFNSLNSIKTYILKEKTQEASSYLTKFSQLMRAVLRNSKSPLVPLRDELRALQLYIELEALRFEDEFEYEIKVGDGIEQDQLVVPPLLIQPYVENAIRHGLLEKEEGSRKLLVEVAVNADDQIRITVEDNGIGREKSLQRTRLNEQKKSYGMQITKDRIDLIRQTLNIHTDVEIEDLISKAADATGTKVCITIPKLYQHATSEYAS